MDIKLIPAISDTRALQTLLNQRWGKLLDTHFATILEQENHAQIKWWKVGRTSYKGHILVLSSIFLAALLLVFFQPETEVALLWFDKILWPLFILVLIIAFSIPYLLVVSYQKRLGYKKTEPFTVALQSNITQCISDIFSKQITYTDSNSNHDSYFKLHAELAESMLIDEIQSVRHTSLFKNTYGVRLERTTLTLAECSVHIGQTTTDNGLNIKPVFHGYFAVIELSKTLEHKTFLATKNGGYGNNYRIDAPRTPPPNATQLEWNEFNKLIHVSTTDETEARYILTTDFMVALFEWWQDKHAEIRISFINNKVYILWEDNFIQAGTEKAALDREKIFVEVLALSKKFLHVFHLIESLPTHLTASHTQ